MNKTLIFKCYCQCLFYLILFLVFVMEVSNTYIDIIGMVCIYVVILGDIRNPLATYTLNINSIDLLTNSFSLILMYNISIVCTMFLLPFIIIDMVLNIYRIKFNMKEVIN